MRHLARRLALVALVLLAPAVSWGQNTLTVYDDATGTNEFVPFYGYYADNDQQNQMIYPASELSAMTGNVITQMVFYVANVSGSNDIGNWTVSLGETSATTLSGLDNTTSLSQVYSGAMTFNSGETLMTVTFDEGYVYNGGNLLVEFNHSAASYKRYYFTGETVTGASYCHNGQRDFLPKITFTYEAATGPTCAKPDQLTAIGTPTAHEFSFSITGGSGLYNIFTKAGDGEWTNWEYEWEETTVNLTGLTPLTNYQVRVQSVCTDITDPETGDAATSGWKNLSFTTPCGAIDLPYSYGFENGNLSDACWTLWGASSSGIASNSDAAHDGSSGFRFNYNETTAHLISPQFSGTTSGLTVSFFYKEYSSQYVDEEFQVGYTTSAAETDPTQRGYGDFKYFWEFPGGKIEAGESADQALRREIWEELQTRIVVERLFRTVEYDYPQFHLSMQCFLCRIESGHPVLLEHEAARWLSPAELDSVEWFPADS